MKYIEIDAYSITDVPKVLPALDQSNLSTQQNVFDEEDVDDEEMGVAETYSDYMPTKRKFHQ